MTSIDVTFTERVSFRACYDGCSNGWLFLDFLDVPKQVLWNAWPKDGNGQPIPINYKLSAVDALTDAQAFPDKTGTILPDFTQIAPPAVNDGIYRYTFTLYDWITPSNVGYELTNLVVVDSDAQCCQEKLTAKMLEKKCDRGLEEDVARITALREALGKLLTCDNDVAGAKNMLDTVNFICRKYNCNC